MNSVAAFVTLFGLLSSTGYARGRLRGDLFAVTANCSADSQPCGPAPSCCAAGHKCNFLRGIPSCLDVSKISKSGFGHMACADPYLFPCDIAIGTPGFCCPIGTSCFTEGDNNNIHCINALGTTAPAIPSATTGLIPSSTPISPDDPAILYSPSHAWNASNSGFTCTTSTSLRRSDVINSTISFNYTGPSIMVRTVSSSSGGVFAIFVDGMDTTGLIDTFSGPGNLALPTCYPVQFPPFIKTPPGYEKRVNHTITLVYIRPSELAPEGTNSSVVEFDSFAIPDLQSVLVATSGQRQQNLNIYLFLAVFVCCVYSVV